MSKIRKKKFLGILILIITIFTIFPIFNSCNQSFSIENSVNNLSWEINPMASTDPDNPEDLENDVEVYSNYTYRDWYYYRFLSQNLDSYYFVWWNNENDSDDIKLTLWTYMGEWDLEGQSTDGTPIQWIMFKPKQLTYYIARIQQNGYHLTYNGTIEYEVADLMEIGTDYITELNGTDIGECVDVSLTEGNTYQIMLDVPQKLES